MKVNVAHTVKWISFGVVVLLLVFAGAFSWMNHYNEKKSKKVGDMMYNALISEVSNDEMIKILNDVAGIKGCNYQYLAKFKLASIYGEDQVDKAQVIYADLAADKNLVPELRELAEYLEIVTLLKSDRADLLKSKVEQLLSKRLNVYKSSAKEIMAISMIKDNDINGAIGIIKEIVGSSDSEPIVYKNAMDLLQIYEH